MLAQTTSVGIIERLGVAAIAASLSGTAFAAGDTPICPDRPSKGTGACTVPAGHWQIETGLVDWTHDRTDGVASDATELGASLIKYGLADRLDVELGITPYETVRARGDGVSSRVSELGDLVIRSKLRLTGDDASVQVALDPFVKLPTAKHDLGNGKVEGGVDVPVSMALGHGPFSLAIAPELDWIADADGHGHHAAMVQLIDLGIAASSKLSLTAELWRQWDWDPAGTGKQTSADGAVAYLVGNALQLDGGANLGLNRETPDLELYAGVSARF
jgi:Putative MetA-pathway of phenol degradation